MSAAERAVDRRRWVVRGLFGVAAVLLLVSVPQPYWRLDLLAPQYPGGLRVEAYLDHLEGDVREIDGLNHYIGMRPLDEAARFERRIGRVAVVALALLTAVAAFGGRHRWWLGLPAIAFPVLFLADLYYWLRKFGTHLDPTAPLSSSIEPFVPPVLGMGKVGQFATVAAPDVGLVLALVAASLVLFGGVLGRVRRSGAAVLLVLVAAGASPAASVERRVPSIPGALAAALAESADGDRIVVGTGVHLGSFRVDRAIELVGEDGAILSGGGAGTVVTVRAAGATVRNLEIRDSGSSLDQENAGIAVEASGVTVSRNRLVDVLFGVYLRRADGSTVDGNSIEGQDRDLPRRGDAIRVWYSDDAVIRGNVVRGARDVVLWYSERLSILDNDVAGGRYGLHFMYCDDARIEGNRLEGNSVGAFLMYSRRLRLRDNQISGSRGPSGYGVGMKDMDDAVLSRNLLFDNRVGVYLDNSPRETTSDVTVKGNVFAANSIGLLAMPNVRRLEAAENDFIANQEQMAWGGAGGDPEASSWVGNYWSDYRGYDANGDGEGDVPYRADRLFEDLIERYPTLRFLAGTPAAHAADVAARAFPVVRPRPKLSDPRPRIQPGAGGEVPPPPGGVPGPWPIAAAALLAGSGLLTRVARIAPPARAVEREAAKTGSAPVEVRGLSVRFGSRCALDGVDFVVEPGEAVALCGRNGAGKSTALHALLGLVPFAGTVSVAGLDPRRAGAEARARIGFVPQKVALDGSASVGDTVAFFCRLRSVPESIGRSTIARLGLEDRWRDRVGSLSGGLAQRLAIGLALLADPPVLLMDEPTANLDAEGRALFHELLTALRRRGKTVIFTSHHEGEVAAATDRVVRLDDGRVVGGATS